MTRAFLYPLLVVFSSTLFGQQLIISTVAGGSAPPTPSAAAHASLGDPARVAVDAAGSVYFSSLHSVFKVDVNGTVTRVAGNGRFGYAGDGNAATTAQLATPDSIAVDASGRIYVSDRAANVVRVIAASGTIGTAAGNGTAGFSGDGGLAVDAQLNAPTGIALDGVGNLYISDSGNNVIRRVSTNGNIATFAGSGTEGFGGDGNLATAAALDGPEGIAVDSAGNLYIADTFNNRVREVAADGSITTVAGTGTSAFSGDTAAPAASATLFLPTAVAVDRSGTLFIADYGNSRIRTVIKGMIATVIGSKAEAVVGDDEPALSVRLNGPTGVAVDGGGTIYFAEGSVGTGSGLADGDYKVWKLPTFGAVFTAAGNGIASYSGDGGQATAAQLNTPSGMALDGAGNLYFADALNHRVRRVSPTGVVDTIAGTGKPGFSGDSGPAVNAQLDRPESVALDQNGALYIADTNNNRIRKVSRDGTITTLAGNGNAAFLGDGGPATVAALHAPQGVAVDGAGNVFIADTLDHRVRKVEPDGTIATIAGSGLAGLSGDGGAATAAQLNGPASVAVDSAGNVYIADTGNARIRVVSPLGNISTAVGGNAAANAQLASPGSVALDAAGNLYVADTGHNRVLIVSANAAVTTLGGNGTCCYSGDGGPAAVAQLNAPGGIAVDSTGRVYVADTGNNAIRLIQNAPSGGLPTITAIANGASNVTGPIAPGEIVVVYGSGLGPAQLTQSAGAGILFNGTPGVLIYASATQVSAIVPNTLSGSTVQVVAQYQNIAGGPVTAQLAGASPALFTADSTGFGQAAAVNQDGTANNASHPAPAGSTIALFVNGAGSSAVSVTIGGQSASLASNPNLGAPPGVTVVTAQIPSGVQPGNAVPVLVQAAGLTSPSGVTIAISSQ